MIDIHNHILPGIDDGATDWEQSIAMAHVAVEDGITDIVCTPHWVLGKYENTRGTVLTLLDELKKRLSDNGIALRLHPGMELRLDSSLISRIQEGEILTINDRKAYALIELPEEALPRNLEDFFWQLQLQNIKPIIGHVERNPVLRQDPIRLYRWAEMGIITQVTAASLLEEFSPEIRDFAIQIVEHRMVHVLVTDAHGLRMRTPKLSDAYKVVENILGPDGAREMTCDLPGRILMGEPVLTAEPIPMYMPSSRPSFWQRIFSFK